MLIVKYSRYVDTAFPIECIHPQQCFLKWNITKIMLSLKIYFFMTVYGHAVLSIVPISYCVRYVGARYLSFIQNTPNSSILFGRLVNKDSSLMKEYG